MENYAKLEAERLIKIFTRTVSCFVDSEQALFNTKQCASWCAIELAGMMEDKELAGKFLEEVCKEIENYNG